MSKVQFVVLFNGKYPLSWPSSVRNGKDEEDPGEVVEDIKQASRFDTEAEAREKAMKHYHQSHFSVAKVVIPI